MSIQILSKEVINQIAAGEVLERPSNLVKELIENSIDAGATEIEIDLDIGGKFLKIQDNGSGMDREDLTLSLSRHSTSKLKNFSDLWSLRTYGFRGEALASAAAVSKMTIVTRRSEAEVALQIQSDFGQQGDILEMSGDYGTQITIDELFSNVPARLKFLKSDSGEVTQIMKVIKAFALISPDVMFKVKQKGILKAFYPKAESHLARAMSVLDVPELFENKKENVNAKAHVIHSSPNTVAKTSQNIWIFVQRRWIQDRALQKAILDSYRNLLMHGEYPFAVLHLECDPQLIDVNIHPAKSQVKFQDPGMAFRIVHGVTRESLEKAPWLKNMFDSNGDHLKSVEKAIHNYYQRSGEEDSQNIFSSHQAGFGNTQFKQKNYDMRVMPEVESPPSGTYIQQPAAPQANLQGVGADPMWGGLQVLGQVNLTYILAQSRQALFLVDQHAAHERVNFEKLMNSFKKGQFEVQSYLLPLNIDFEPDKFEAILNLQENLKKIGIEIEQAGPTTLSVNSAPTLVKEKALSEILNKMAEDAYDQGESYSLEKRNSDVFASMACHSSVRAGQSLSNEEMKELLIQMDEFPLSSFCPHGRPVFKQLSFKELDRDFGRIV
jgi:DNA mismatch repair protein MutL